MTAFRGGEGVDEGGNTFSQKMRDIHPPSDCYYYPGGGGILFFFLLWAKKRRFPLCLCFWAGRENMFIIGSIHPHPSTTHVYAFLCVFGGNI